MSFTTPTTPNLADFVTFCQNQGVSATFLDPSSEYYAWAFTRAQDIALFVPQMPSIIYVLAVYNLGMHTLIKIAQDVGTPFFSDMRKTYFLLSAPLGSINSSSDNGTSQSNVISEWQKNLTLSGMDLMRTPWGRDYLDYAQQYGSTIVGVS